MGDLRRSLTNGEKREAETMFRGRIDYDRMKVIRGKYMPFQPGNTAMAPNGNIYFPPPIYQPDYAIDPDPMSFLIHELTHVWQIQTGMWLKLRRVFLDGGTYDYVLEPAKPLMRYKVEQQASIVADYYRLGYGLGPLHGNGSRDAYARIVGAAMGY